MQQEPAKRSLDFDRDLSKFTPRQAHATGCLDSGEYKYLMYGGCLGGGKSYWLRWYAVRRLMVLFYKFGLKNAVGMLACEDYPALKDRQLSKIATEFPPWLGKYHADHKTYGRCFILAAKWGAGIIAFRNLDDASKYQSAEFAFILVDELTKNTFEVFTDLRSRLRWPGLPDSECQFAAGTNPGGVGHGWVKAFWIDEIFSDEWASCKHQFKFVPSKAIDNPHLDKDYYKTLDSLPEQLRKAFRDGDWNIFVGQAFDFKREVHVIKSSEHPVPRSAPIYMTFDWGFGKPFSIGWWWIDSDGRAYRFSEWYGWNGVPDVGLRLTDEKIAEGIINREAVMGIDPSTINRLAGHDCWNKKPNFQGGGQGKSTAEVLAEKGIFLTKADPSRSLKIRQFRSRLAVDEKTNLPMVLIYDKCTNFIRTIPNLVVDDTTGEDIDSKGEDHIYDEACQLFMARPVEMTETKRQVDADSQRIDRLTKPIEDNQKAEVVGALIDWRREDQMDEHLREFYEGAHNMGGMVPTCLH